MFVSEARIHANRINAAKSKGPTSEAGKMRSRANGLKHGLSGEGVVLAQEHLSEVDALEQALLADLNPQTAAGHLLVRRLAVLSMQMDRGADYESAAIALRVRHAVEAFDEARLEEADALLDAIGEAPRSNLRKLKKSPEGVDRLIEAWTNLRDDATREVRPVWTAWHLERAVNMTGLRIEAAHGSLFKLLSKAIWGDFRAIEDLEKEDIAGDTRKAQARCQLVEKIDAEIASLHTHRETLDLTMIELDRSEAGSRALFDPSKEAALARRYESEAQRNFFKAYQELRRVEAEFAAQPEPEFVPEMGSCREIPPPVADVPPTAGVESIPRAENQPPDRSYPPCEPIRSPDGRVVRAYNPLNTK